MIKIFTALLCALLALPAWATCSTDSTASTHATVTCTTGTESAPSQSSTDGLRLEQFRPVVGITVHAETAGTMTAGGVLQAYAQNPVTGQWNRSPDLDLTVQALARQAWVGLSVPAARGRIVWYPSGTGLATTIYIIAAY